MLLFISKPFPLLPRFIGGDRGRVQKIQEIDLFYILLLIADTHIK